MLLGQAVGGGGVLLGERYRDGLDRLTTALWSTPAHFDADTLHVEAATPSAEAVSVRCNGEPVLLARPTCTLTAHEALWYAVSTPVVAIRCPYGAAGYITGFSKATRGAQ